MNDSQYSNLTEDSGFKLSRSKLGSDIKDTAFLKYMKHMKRQNFIKTEQKDQKNIPNSPFDVRTVKLESDFD